MARPIPLSTRRGVDEVAMPCCLLANYLVAGFRRLRRRPATETETASFAPPARRRGPAQRTEAAR